MKTDAVTYLSNNDIAVITLNRAERINRLDSDIIDGLEAAWIQFMASNNDRVAIITGDGTSFSA